jgi:multidrug efflux pump subunit AcrB
MSHGHSDSEIIARTHNTARFFTEWRHIAWVLLAANIAWGVYGYWNMPQRKDPDIPVRQALVLVHWPGAGAERIEQLITRRVEEKVAENVRVEKIESNTRTGVTSVIITLVEGLAETGKEFDDIKLKLDTISDLPEGAGPITFVKDFGDTAALMLTVASPKADDAQIALTADLLSAAIRRERAAAALETPRVTLVITLPAAVNRNTARRQVESFRQAAMADGILRDARTIDGPGFLAVDAGSDATDAELDRYMQHFIRERLRMSEFHPDAGRPVVIRDPGEARERLAAVAGSKYTYRELDDFTERIARTLRGLPVVSKVTRSGVLEERVFLEYSQERLASFGVNAGQLRDVLGSRNISNAGGTLEIGTRQLSVEPSGEFKSEQELENVLVPTRQGAPVYLRDLADVSRAYVSPPSYLNFHTALTADGRWEKSRAITLAVQMRSGAQIGAFGQSVDATLDEVRQLLPADLILARTSDQPSQVEENIDLFMDSLYEAIGLVVIVSLIGFWEWRSALLMALSIPITLTMTFGMMAALGLDLQQISIASLIIALGLLVDDPVVAGDAIKRELGRGHAAKIAAWLGPTKLATAILFATITNIVAYLPYMLLPGDTGTFLYSLPVVIGCSLVASRLVSMTFIPLLGYYLLKPRLEPTVEERRQSGFAAMYFRFGQMAIRRRWAFLTAMSVVVLGSGAWFGSQLKSQFFPIDLQYLAYVDVWLPEDSPLSATAETTEQVEAILRRVSAGCADRHAASDLRPREVLRSLTTFIGGGGPRFWYSVGPEQSQLNYSQVLFEMFDKHDTRDLSEQIQIALNAEIAGARIDVRQLETGAPVGIPVSIRISGDDIASLRNIAADTSAVLRDIPIAAGVRDNWGPESMTVRLSTDTDRASMSSVTNLDVASASSTALSGALLTTLRDGADQIPVMARLRMEERAALSDIRNLYVYSSSGPQKLPLEAISSMDYRMQSEKLQRRNQFRTITVSAFPAAGHLSSEVLELARPRFKEIERNLPPGYRFEIGGEYEEQVKGFFNLTVVLVLSVAMIFIALVVQFRNAIKPFIVFAAIPYGFAGALAALWLMGAPFGFMAFLGIVSLVGVIVSHIIVLFDFIEEMHEQGQPLEDALLNAGIVRLRPVLITVAATVFALIPLALHGGPLWEPMCYAQIGGLTVATFVTLIVVPVLYAICVRDLKIVSWNETTQPAS